MVIRVTDPEARSLGEMTAELDWIEHLRQQGLVVCEALPSTKNNKIEVINDKLVVVFKKFSGQRIEDSQLTEPQVRLWASTMAQMHKATFLFKPLKDKRNIWFEDSIYTKSMNAFDLADEEVQSKFKELDLKLRRWPRDSKKFGLIHSDLHTGNFFFQNDHLAVFDFDDSCYNFVFVDLSIPIRIIAREFGTPDLIDKRDCYIRLFFETYFRSHPATAEWKKEFEICYRYYALLVHLWLLAIMKERELTFEQQKDFLDSIDQIREQGMSTEISDILADIEI